MSSVIIALVVGVFAGALVVWLVTRGQGNPAVLQSQGEIKAMLDVTLAQVQRLGAIFANAAQRGRAGELVLENLLEATGMDRHRDFEVQVATEGARPDVVLNLPGRGRLVIDAKFPLDDFQRAAAAAGEGERRKALAAHAKAVAGHVSALRRSRRSPGPCPPPRIRWRAPSLDTRRHIRRLVGGGRVSRTKQPHAQIAEASSGPTPALRTPLEGGVD